MKIKKLFSLAFLMIVFVLYSSAQNMDKYIYGCVYYELVRIVGTPTIYSTLDDKYEEIKIDKEEIKKISPRDISPLTKYVSKPSDGGWNVINVAYSPPFVFYFLHKKVN